MPYLSDDRKAILTTDVMQAKEEGDYNYLYSVAYLKEFLKEPRYKTIAKIRRASMVPHTYESVGDIEDRLVFLGVPEIDREVARDLAFLEFYNRIGRMYEDFAIEKNGDVKEYPEAEDCINELIDRYYGSLK